MALSISLRTLGRNPVFAPAAVLTIALGIGLNTAVYSLIRAVLLDPLPYRDPERLVYLWETHPRFPVMAVAAPDYRDWKQARSFEQMAAYTIQTMNRGILSGKDRPVHVQAVMASHELFPMLGTAPLLGRAFTAEEEQGGKPVAMISERLWRSHFEADPAIVGRAVRMEQTVFTVVGVVARRGAFPAWADFWMPLSFLERELEAARKFHPLEVVARLRPGVSATAAAQELQAIMRGLAERFPATNGGEGASVIPMQGYQVAPVRGALLVVWAAVGMVLLIVCVNVAHLVLARTAARERELAIRMALGATRARIAGTLLGENVTLALVGGVLGLALAAGITPLAARHAAARLPLAADLTFDSGVAAFGCLVSLAAMVLSCLPALWSALRPALRPAMETAARARMSRALVAFEIALAFVVLASAALLVRSFGRLVSVDPGFDSNGVIAMNVTLPRPAYDWEKSRQWFDQQLAPRLRELAGVEAVATGNLMPLTMPGADQIHRFATRFGLPGETASDGRYPIAQVRWGTEDYFRVLGIRLVGGRWLTEADRGMPRNVINETLARRYFPGQDPVGKQLVFGVADPAQSRAEIVGVVSDVRDLSLELTPEPTIYSLGMSMSFALLVRGTGLSAETVAAAVRAAEPDSVTELAGSIAAIEGRSLERRSLGLMLLAGFAAIAALLAAIGIYGVVSYTTGRRVKEIGLRMALGAAGSDVRTMILRETAAVAFAGLLLGAVLSLLLAPIGRPLLYAVEPYDPAAWACSAGLLLLMALIAVWIPATGAARLDPARALRRE